MAQQGILRHSRWDAMLIGLSIVHGTVLITAPSIPIVALGLWWNSNTISHNFIHLPFFRSTTLNRLYALYLTLVLGYPQSWWQSRHLAHHSGSVPRIPITRTGVAEASLIACTWIVLLVYATKCFLTVYLPGFAAGLALCYIHGYFEHAGGAKSNYGLLYNAPFFNDGYHVEHHCRPAEHWTRLPQQVVVGTMTSRWPAVLRWLDVLNLEMLERLVLRSSLLQKFLLNTHERAIRRLLPKLEAVRTIQIVGGGMFPRTHGFAEVAPECRNHDHRCERCEHGQNVPHPARKGTWSHRGC
jgi:Fatty acid desaturase